MPDLENQIDYEQTSQDFSDSFNRDRYVMKNDLPGTVTNTTGTQMYAKLMDIKTSFYCNSSAKVGVVANVTFFLIRAFTYTTTTLDEVLFSLRIKTGLTPSENSLVFMNAPQNFRVQLTYDPTTEVASVYVACNIYERVRFQIVEGDERFATFYYDAPFDTLYANLPPKLDSLYDPEALYRKEFTMYNVGNPSIASPIKFRRLLGTEDKAAYMYVGQAGNTVITEPNDYSLGITNGSNYLEIGSTGAIIHTPTGGALYPATNLVTRLGTIDNRWDTAYVKRIEIYGTSIAPVRFSRDISSDKKTGNLYVDSNGNTILTCSFPDSSTIFDHSSKLEITETNTIIHAPTGGGLQVIGDYIQVPCRSTAPANPQNGYKFFHTVSKKEVVYYNGSWYSDGVAVSV